MAEETNQNDQVKDLLARLRSQMSQLDEAFGLVDGKEKPESTPVAIEEPEEDGEAEEIGVEAEREIEAGSKVQPEEPEGLSDEMPEAEPLPEIIQPDPTPVPEAKPDEMPSQLDFFAALEDEQMLAEEEMTTAPSEKEAVSVPDANQDEDELVFAETDVPVCVRRESIVAGEAVTVSEEVVLAPVVVEIDRNETPQREKKRNAYQRFRSQRTSR